MRYLFAALLLSACSSAPHPVEMKGLTFTGTCSVSLDGATPADESCRPEIIPVTYQRDVFDVNLALDGLKAEVAVDDLAQPTGLIASGAFISLVDPAAEGACYWWDGSYAVSRSPDGLEVAVYGTCSQGPLAGRQIAAVVDALAR